MGTNYYLETSKCSTCGRLGERRHIGKYSVGWSFHFHGDKLGTKSFADWKKEFIKPNTIIVDEDGDEISIEDFCSLVEESRGSKYNYYDYVMSDWKLASTRVWEDEEGWSFSSEEFS